MVLLVWLVLAVAWVPPLAAKEKQADKAQPVVTAVAQRKPMPLLLSTIGTVRPLNVVTVRPRLEGEIVRMAFQEGDEVAAGDVLFELDSRAAEVQLAQRLAEEARAKAELERAQADARRYASLLKSGSTTPQKAEEAQAVARALEADLRAAEAAVAEARLELSYATIHAPIAGRTGAVPAKIGNLVRPGDALVTITQIRPIAVAFHLPERHLPLLRRALAEQAPVRASHGEATAEGGLSFIDSSVDSTTGTIALKAGFANASGELWPGSFVAVELRAAVDRDAVVVPSQAVQNGQEGQYVYVVTAGAKAERRMVTVDRVQDGEAVIAQGLAPGERVVLDGQFRLFDGVPVRDVSPPPPAGPAEQSERRS